MAKIVARLLAGLLTAASLVLPVAAGELIARHFTDPGPAVEATWTYGVGIYDPGDPDNICLGSLGIRLVEYTDTGVAFYYHGLRLTDNSGFDPVPTQQVGPLPDPTNDISICFGFDPTQSQVAGASEGSVRASPFVRAIHLVGVDEIAVPGSVTARFEACPTVWSWSFVPGSSGGLASLGNAADFDCGGPAYVTDASGLLTEFVVGEFGHGFATAAVRDIVPEGFGHRAVEGCVTAEIFNVVFGFSSVETDEDHFFVFDTVPETDALSGAKLALAVSDVNKQSNLEPNVGEGCAPVPTACGGAFITNGNYASSGGLFAGPVRLTVQHSPAAAHVVDWSFTSTGVPLVAQTLGHDTFRVVMANTSINTLSATVDCDASGTVSTGDITISTAWSQIN